MRSGESNGNPKSSRLFVHSALTVLEVTNGTGVSTRGSFD
jgi:hypothetical protein